eukprot:TRINITY_DN4568_c0_g1_i3.p1 TRINITY_DN4568_c0_g1~~TRINITY_DN4568_c0_g1_i3.p1  ORF type:complete len:684 (+),score=196.56 TRINITY_DN4568_c0_g1_i3:126-2177(+)
MSSQLTKKMKIEVMKKFVQSPRKRSDVFRFSLANAALAGREKRSTDLEMFQRFTKSVLPKLEELVEIRLLKKEHDRLSTSLEKQELLLAFKRRQVEIAKLPQELEPFIFTTDVHSFPPVTPDNIYSNDILKHTEQEISSYVVFPAEDLGIYFSKGGYGDYIKEEFSRTSRFGLMCTEEGLRIAAALEKIVPEQTINYRERFRYAETKEDAKAVLNDEDLYPRIFHDFARTMNKSLDPYRNDELMVRLFTNANFFDCLVNMLVRQLVYERIRPFLADPASRQQICDQILVQVKDKVDPNFANPQIPNQLFEALQQFTINLPGVKNEEEAVYEIPLKSYATSPRPLPEVLRKFGPGFFGFNSGLLLHGRHGAGKSGVLYYASMWAHKKGWVVMSVPSAYRLTWGPYDVKRHHDTGLYLQTELTQELLSSFRKANLALLREIPVNKKLYGKFNMAGIHDDEYDPVRIVYYPERKVWSNDWERFLKKAEREGIEREAREIRFRLADKLPNPKTLLDIVDYRLKDSLLCTNAYAELLEQLYNMESHSFLLVVDDYNWFFRPTAHPSFRYANDPKLDTKIPAYHLALCRPLLRFDGHRIRNGFKLVASGHKKQFKHNFNPKDINLGPGYDIKMDGLPLNDFRTMVQYYTYSGFWRAVSQNNPLQIEGLYLETQGNWAEVHKMMLKPVHL